MHKSHWLLRACGFAFALLLGTFGARAEDNTTNSFNAVTNDLGTGALTVGLNGSNNVLIASQGGSVFDGTGLIGDGSNANNNLVWVKDSGSVWSNSGELDIAAGTSPSSLRVISVITNIGTQQVSLGDTNLIAATNYFLNWTTVMSNGVVGGSSNILMIADGGKVFSSAGKVGTGGAAIHLFGYDGGAGGAENNVIISGSGSEWLNTADVSLGAGGDGASGDWVNSLGFTNGLIFLGSTSSYISASGNAGCGGAGNSLIVSNGAKAIGANVSLGKAGVATGNGIGGVGGDNNSIFITGSGSVLSNSSNVALGAGGLGFSSGNFGTLGGIGSWWATNGACGGSRNHMVISDGGSVYSAKGSLGAGGDGQNSGKGGSNNSVCVSGVGAKWTTSSNLCVGTGGAGASFYSGAVQAGTNLVAGGDGGDGNVLMVTNGGLVLLAGADIGAGGKGGDNGINIEAGANGGAGGCSNLFAVIGKASVVSNSADFNLGTGGYSGQSSTTGAEGGPGGDGNGLLIADGGRAFCGSLNIGRPPDFDPSGDVVMYRAVPYAGTGGSSNGALITGTGTLLRCSAAINILSGLFGGNSVVVSNGGTVYSASGEIEGANNYVMVMGNGSLWSNSASFNMSVGGLSDRLVLADGGVVCASNIIFGIGGSNNTGIITGHKTRWSSAGSFTLGGVGTSLVISNGGALVNRSFSSAGDADAVALSDAGSSWMVSSTLFIGNGGDGAAPNGAGYGVNGGKGGSNNRFMISNASVLSTASCSLGNGGGGSIYHWSYGISFGWSGGYGGAGGDNNNVVVSGHGSTWSNLTDLIISQAGVTDGSGGGGVNNSVMATNSGCIVVGGNVLLGSLTTGSNSQIIAVDGGQVLVTNRSGTGSLNIQNGSLLVQGGVVTVNKLCATNGASSVLQFPAGLLDVGSAMVADGAPFVVGDGRSSATMRLRGGTSVFTDGLIIASNAVLTGTGTILGDVKVYGSVARTVTIIAGIGGTLNATDLAWHTGGDATWYRQTVTTHDGGAALRSGALGAGQQSYFQTTTNGPGSLTFWWKASAAAANTLQFYIDTQLVSQIAGNVDWNQYVGFIATSNPVTLKWVYTKNSAAVSGSDAGFVDQVTWMPCEYVTNAAQIFYQDPTGTLASWVLTGNGGMRFARLLGNTGGWALKAVGDIDGDGVGDLLFQTASGETSGWFMNADGSVRSARALWSMGGWAIKACGDYEGTGHAQVFFQDAAGNALFWRLDTNGNHLTSVNLGNMGGWQLRGLGDLDGDHKAELFWQNAAGQVVIWYHNPNGSIRSVPAFNTGGWLLSGVVDIDADGFSDLLWQDSAGNTGGWFMHSNGTARAASYWWNTGGWKLKAAGR